MSQDQTLEIIAVDELLDRVRVLFSQGHRLVQIGATRLPSGLELTYSFDLDRRLSNLRLHLPATEGPVPSISSIYWCAFLYENEIHDLFGLQINGMAVDFHGKLYQTAIKFPFGSGKTPAAESAAPVGPVLNRPAQEPRHPTTALAPSLAPSVPQ